MSRHRSGSTLVQGHVVDVAGNPLPRAHLRAQHECRRSELDDECAAHRVIATDPQGRFRFRGPPGRWSFFTEWLPEEPFADDDWKAVFPRAEPIELRIAPGFAIRVRVTDAEGNVPRLPDWSVSWLWELPDGSGGGGGDQVLAPAGTWVTGLPFTDVELELRAHGPRRTWRPADRKPVRIAPGGTPEVTLLVERIPRGRAVRTARGASRKRLPRLRRRG